METRIVAVDVSVFCCEICDLMRELWFGRAQASSEYYKKLRDFGLVRVRLNFSEGVLEQCDGDVAQMVERSLSMREVRYPASPLFFFPTLNHENQR